MTMRFAILVPVLLAGFAFAQPTKPAALTPDMQEILFYAESKAVRVQVSVGEAGRSVAKTFESHLRKLFDYLDRDGDGFLSPSEAAFLLSNRGLQSVIEYGRGAPSANDETRAFSKVDADGDGKISFAEFQSFHAPCLAFLVVARDVPPADAFASQVTQDLFSRLDTNKDGKLSREELRAAEKWIELFDRDEDECVSLAELDPTLPAGKEAVKGEDAVRIHPVGVFDETAVELLMLRYDRNRNLRLKPNEIAWDAETFRRLDRNGDGMLSLFELVAWRDGPPDLALELTLDGESSTTRMLKSTDGKDYPLSKESTAGPEGRRLVRVGNQTLEVGFHLGNAAPRSGSKELADAYEKAAHGRESVKLADLAAPDFQALAALFPMADRDGDGQLTKAELKRLLDIFDGFHDAPLLLAYRVESPSLFSLLDVNKDGRLSRRELRYAFDRLIAFEPNGGDYVTMAFARPQGRVFLTRERDVTSLATTSPFIVNIHGDGRGPAWFRKLDRNGDGDISLAEFPGRKHEFDRLDLDGDGFISLAEAEAAEKRFRRK